MKNKRAIIGDFTVTFVATIIIVVTLLIFAIFSGAVREFIDKGEMQENKLGESGMTSYMSKVNFVLQFEKTARGSILSEAIKKNLGGYDANK